MGRTQAYMQDRDSRWKICGGYTANGACFALSTWWIIQTAHGASEGFWNWLGPSEYATCQYRPPPTVNAVQEASNWRKYAGRAGTVVTDILTAMADQEFAVLASDILAQTLPRLNCVARIVEANSSLRAKRSASDVKPYDLTPFQTERHRANSLMEWGTRLSKHRGYKYVTLSGHSKKFAAGEREFQHGIAVFTGYGTYCIFDANIGEFTSDKLTDFQNDLKGIFAHYQYTCHAADFVLFPLN